MITFKTKTIHTFQEDHKKLIKSPVGSYTVPNSVGSSICNELAQIILEDDRQRFGPNEETIEVVESVLHPWDAASDSSDSKEDAYVKRALLWIQQVDTSNPS